MSRVTRRSVDRDKAAGPLPTVSSAQSFFVRENFANLSACPSSEPTAAVRKMVAANRVSRVRDPASV